MLVLALPIGLIRQHGDSTLQHIPHGRHRKRPPEKPHVYIEPPALIELSTAG
jgi:hypothetical protein